MARDNPKRRFKWKISGNFPPEIGKWGSTEDLGAQIGEKLLYVFDTKGRDVKLLSLRVLPSSVVHIGDRYQIVANATFDDLSGPAHPRMIDSVVTLSQRGQEVVVDEVKVPALGT